MRNKTKPIKARSHFKLVLRDISAQKAQTILSILAIILGVSLLVAGDIAGSGYRSGFESIVEAEEIQQSFAFMFDIFESGLNAVGLAVLLTSGFLIFNSFSISISRRRIQIGSIRALGSTRKQVLTGLLLQTLIISVIGVPLGFLIGYVLGQGLLSVMSAAGLFSGQGTLTLVGTLRSILLGLGVTLGAVFFPALRATQISPLSALKNYSEDKDHKSGWRMLFWIGVLIIAALLIYFLISPPGRWTLPPLNTRLPVIFSLAWLAAIGISIPHIIGLTSQLIKILSGKALGPMAMLAGANFGRDRQRVVWTVASFMVGITMLVSLTGILWFSLEGVLRRVSESATLQPRWLLTGGPSDAEPGLEALAVQPETITKVELVAKGRADVAKYYYVIAPKISTMFDYFPSLLIDPDMVLGPGGFNFTEGNLPEAKEMMENGCGLLLTPGVAHRNNVSVGDSLPLTGKSGLIECSVAGIGSGGFIYPTSFISSAAQDQFTISSGPNLIYVISRSEGEAKSLEVDLLELDNQLGDLLEVAGIEGALETVYDLRETFSAFFSGMLILAVFVSGLGIINITMISLLDRRQELGILRAVGASRRQVFRMVVGETLLTGILGGLLGLLSGAGVSMIYVLAHGGNIYGLPDLPLWKAGWEATWPAIKSGWIILLVIPLVCVFAAWIASKRILKGSPSNNLLNLF